MRMTALQVQQVMEICSTTLGYIPRVWLFGSRLDDDARGGDFDLLLEVRHKMELMDQLILQHKLSQSLARKVDLLFSVQGLNDGPWQRLAKTQGVMIHEAA